MKVQDISAEELSRFSSFAVFALLIFALYIGVGALLHAPLSFAVGDF